MKSIRYPMWKRLVSLLLTLILCLSSSGFTAFAEELVLWDEEPAEAYGEPELLDVLIEGEAVEEILCEEEPLPLEEAIPADPVETDAEELILEDVQDAFEAASEQVFLKDRTVVMDEQFPPEAAPGMVRLAAGADLFPEGASLSVTPLPQAEAVELLTLDDSVRFESAQEASDDGSDDLIYDEAIPDGDELLLVNPRRTSDVSANCSVTTETVASYRYEICMLSPEGEVLQPPEGEHVTLAFDLPEASDKSLDVKVLHLPASGAQEELPAHVEGGTVYAETTGFSAFVLEFTRTERRYTATSVIPTPIKNIVDSVVTEEEHLYVVYASSSHPNLVKVFKDMDIWFVEAPWIFDETVTLTVGTSPWEGDVSPTNEYTITVKSHMPGIPYRKNGETGECTKYTLMSSIKEAMGMTIKDGWYIVDKDVTFEKHRLTVLGDVHLILRDGCTLTCKYGIRTATNVDPNTALSIYAEDQGTGLLRCEVAYDRRTTESFYAGIGGNRDEDGGVITVYGGEVMATGAIQGAGIGGGTGGNLRGFTMYDGVVTVKGKKGAGIGGGKDGTITGPIAIHGGTLTAKSLSTDAQDPNNYSAAIGAGEGKNLGADIIIDGGLVIASCTSGGAGIGDNGITSGGNRINDNGAVKISGGHVMASATDGAGIGAGIVSPQTGGKGCTVNISGGFVEAVSSKRGAGIGGSYMGDGGIVTISGGYVIARGTDLKVPFGHGHKWITAEKQTSAARAGLEAIANLLIEAFSRHEFGGAGIGGGDKGNGGTVTISGGTVLAASGGNGSQGIGHGMEGESNGTASITNDYARIQYGWEMDKLNESKRKDVYGWNDITRAKRSSWLTNNAIVYIFPCEHEEMAYHTLDREYHEHVCLTCLYYERGEAHDFDETGICRKCLFNRTGKPVEYDVWFLGTRITSENMEKWGYNHNTRTLDIPENVEWKPMWPLHNGAIIYAEGDLNISGNAWVSPRDTPAEYGVYVKNGTLTFKADSALSFSADRYGVYAPDGLNIENVKRLSFYCKDGGTGVYFGDRLPVVNENVGLKTPEHGKAGGGAIVDKDGKNAAEVHYVRGLTLSFDASGASGTPAPMKGLVKNREYTLPEEKPRRQNYDFLDWDINGTLYDAGMSFSISEDTTAKAVWQEHAHSWKAPIWEWTQDESGRMTAVAQFVCAECDELRQVAASVFPGAATEASCEKAGSVSYFASVRALGGEPGGYSDTKTVTLPALGHDWGEWEITQEATETQNGSERRVCMHDESHIETRVIPRLQHVHNLVKTEGTQPSCTAPGSSEYWTCRDCGKRFADASGNNEIAAADTVFPAKGHTPKSEWDLTVSLAPACETEGLNTYEKRCSVCSTALETRTERVAALGHAWGAWAVTKAATEQTTGIETRSCARCGKAEQHTTPKLEHRHSMVKTEAAASTCTEPGNIAYWTCSGCGRRYADAAGKTEIYESDTVLPAKGHSAGLGWQLDAVTKQPGCTDQGYRRMKLYCSDCGEELSSRGESIAPLGHDWGEWETTLEPTETQEGKQTRVCQRSENHIEERTLPILQHTHTLTAIPAQEPGCVEPGSSAYYRCSGCGLYFADAAGTKPVEPEDMMTDPLGHSAGTWSEGTVETPPACTALGIRSYTLRCARCGEALTTRTERIPALGHAWGEWVIETPATEETEGSEIRTCAHDASHTETRAIPRLQHVHVLVKNEGTAPSCTAPGSSAYWACTGCGRLFSDAEGTTEIVPGDLTLPPKGHTAAADWVSESAEPTCTTPGYARFTLYCSDCGEMLSTRGDAIPALGHIWGAWETVKAPTETEDGEERRICQRDPTHIQTRVMPAQGHTHSLTLVPEKAASCTEEGSRAYYLCTGCGLRFDDAQGENWLAPADTVIAPLGHKAGEWEEESRTPPGCTQPGVKTLAQHCTACGTVLTTRSEILPAAGHDWGKATYLWSDDLSLVIAERRCRNDESHIQQEICDEVEIETAVPASCEGEGTALYRAVFENPAFDSEKTRSIPALGHAWGEWTVTRAATETEDGEQTRICENDPSHIETAVIPSFTHVHRLTAVPAKAPGCAEEGNAAYWICESCDSIFTDAAGEQPASYDTVFLAPLGHDWQQDGEAVWTDDRFSALLRFVCRRDPSHTREVLAEAQVQPETTLPTKDADGSVTYAVTAELDGKTYTQQRIDPITRPGYTFTREAQHWIRGSGRSAVFRVTRGNGSDEFNHDKLTLALFTGIEIDGMSVVAENYSVQKGSVIVTLKSAYLETLSYGKHSLTVNFCDGAVTTSFLVAEASDPLPYHYTKEDVLRFFGNTAPAPRDGEDDTSTLFLGWYADAEYSDGPIETEGDIPDTGAYARFIPANALALGIQFRTNSKTGDPNKTDLRFVASVPDKSLYSEIGFDIDYMPSGSADYSDLTDAHYSEKIYSDYVWQTIGDQVTKFEIADAVRLLGANARWSKNLTCCALLGMPNSLYRDDSTPVETDFRVTLYLVTKDGVRSEITPKEFYITYNGTKPVPAKRG